MLFLRVGVRCSLARMQRHELLTVSGRLQDDGAMTWEPSDNMSEDLLRDFEESFWQACKTADMDTLEPALQYGGDTAANLTDADKRCPLHFAAATNRKALIERLFKAGAHMHGRACLPAARATVCVCHVGSLRAARRAAGSSLSGQPTRQNPGVSRGT